MTERQLCIHIPVDVADSASFEKIKTRVEERKPESGQIYVWHQERRSCIRGGERAVLNRIVEGQINGELVAVDGITPSAVNASVNVTKEEANRLKDAGYEISAVQKLED